jgi:hypothetical protein
VEAAGIEGAARSGPACPSMTLRGPAPSEAQRCEVRSVALPGPAWPQMGLAPVQNLSNDARSLRPPEGVRSRSRPNPHQYMAECPTVWSGTSVP